MASCRIVNASVAQAVETIAQISKDYQNAGDTFIKDLNAAISEMEGAAKDALKAFIDKDTHDFVADQLPKAIDGMSQLLEGNRKNFEDVDAQIASSISG
jgi:predicted oxidoreductase